MKSTKKVLALALASTMCVGMLTACNNSTTTTTDSGNGDQQGASTLVVGDGNYDGKFSPFFVTSAYDQNIVTMTQLPLIDSDREGAMVLNGIEGETREYNGTDYTYTGISDVVITENEDGTVYYDITLKDGVMFSDGTEMDIDDVIFTMYVLCDPTYDGSATLYSQPILGMTEYRSGMESKFNLIVKAGEANTDFTLWTQEEQTALWADLKAAGAAFAQEIVDYCVANGYAADSNDVATAAAAWAYEGLAADATAEDFFLAMAEAYEWDLATMSSTESAGSSLFDLMESYETYNVGVETGESAPNIEGIQKTGDNSMRIVTTEVSATAIYQIALTGVGALHHYGDEALYDYDNNQFGFTKGDLSSVRAQSTNPVGAGPYKFVSYENATVTLEANEYYFKGEPKIQTILFKETSEPDKISGVTSGTLDITDPSFSVDAIDEMTQANGTEDMNGPVITIKTVDNLGYGYVGINADNVNVGGVADSDASKNLRKALATVLAVYRDVAIDSYYGEWANVINYPISDTSWAAPRVTDDGYQVAFSTDVNGNPIYTDGMTDDEKYEAAKTAALGFLEAAGYTITDGKATAAPEGASLEYELIIGGSGQGDHPSFMMCTLASDALKEIGINLIVTDIANSSDLFAQMEAGTAELFAAAWSATVDPDMYQIYHSEGGSNYNYDIRDAELDDIIVQARSTTDQATRTLMYKEALDIVMDWAVEIPVYQRANCFIFSTERINLDTLTPDITTYWNWMNDIELLELN